MNINLECKFSVGLSINGESQIKMKDVFFEKAIQKHYPELVIKSFSHIQEGQDFYVFQANKNLIFRFAKSEKEIEKLKFEVELLPKLKNVLPVSIPDFIYKSFTEAWFSFVGYKKIEGIPFNILGDKLSVEFNAKIIGKIITNLNDFRSPDLVEIEQQRKIWENYFIDFIQRIKESAAIILSTEIRNTVEEILLENEISFLSFKFIPCLIHSDFKSSHILCDKQNKVIGLIDWGDSNYGDIAFDFARILNEFGYAFLLKVKESIDSKIRYDIDRITFYTILIPFLTIFKGINSNDKTKLRFGIKKLEFNLQQYSKLL